MRNLLRDLMIVTVIAAIAVGILQVVSGTAAQTPAFRARRLDGASFPDLSGTW